jgi:hypothetical protein
MLYRFSLSHTIAEFSCNRPSYDHLFSMNWNENCCFYGNSNTYMTFPIRAKEQRFIQCDAQMFRGVHHSIPDRRSQDSIDEDEEQFETGQRDVSEEDLYVSNEPPRSLLALSRYLMNGQNLQSIDTLQNFLLNRKRNLRANEMLNCLLQYFVPLHLALGTAPFPLDVKSSQIVNVDASIYTTIFLDYLPILRNISVHEYIIECVGKVLSLSSSTNSIQENEISQDQQQPRRRMNTRHSRSRGHLHYLETITPSYVWEESKYTVQDVASKFVNASLIYRKIENAAASK